MTAKKHNITNEEIKAAADAATDEHALSKAAKTTPPKGLELKQMATDQAPLDYRMAAMEKRIEWLSTTLVHLINIYGWPMPPNPEPQMPGEAADDGPTHSDD